MNLPTINLGDRGTPFLVNDQVRNEDYFVRIKENPKHPSLISRVMDFVVKDFKNGTLKPIIYLIESINLICVKVFKVRDDIPVPLKNVSVACNTAKGLFVIPDLIGSGWKVITGITGLFFFAISDKEKEVSPHSIWKEGAKDIVTGSLSSVRDGADLVLWLKEMGFFSLSKEVSLYIKGVGGLFGLAGTSISLGENIVELFSPTKVNKNHMYYSQIKAKNMQINLLDMGRNLILGTLGVCSLVGVGLVLFLGFAAVPLLLTISMLLLSIGALGFTIALFIFKASQEHLKKGGYTAEVHKITAPAA